MQPIVLKDDSLARGIERAGSALGSAMMEVAKDKRQLEKRRRSLSPFEEAMKTANDPTIQKKSPTQLYIESLSLGANPEEAASSAKMLMYQQQENAQTSALDASMQYGGLSSPEGRNAFLNQYAKSGGDFQKVNELLKTPKKGQESTVDKELGKVKAKAIIDVVQGGGKGQAMVDNLAWLEKNIDKVGSIKGISNRGPMQSELFAEFENKGRLMVEPIIKIFNPAGTLPTKKLEWIRDNFAISPYDTQNQIRGKLNAVKPLVNIALDYQSKVADLVDKYGANIPNEEFFKISKKLNNEFNSIYDKQFERKVYSDLNQLNPKEMKGRTITNPSTGQKLRSNGTEWVSMGE